MARFFYNFPKIDYKFADGSTQKLVDINVKFNLSDASKKTDGLYYPFIWRESDRLDILADKYYGTSDYYWLVMMANDVYDAFHDTPMPTDIFNKYLINKYKQESSQVNDKEILEYCLSTIHHYEDNDGYWIDLETFTTKGYTKSVSIYDYEFDLNEKKKSIKLVDNERASSVKSELEKRLKEVKVIK